MTVSTQVPSGSVVFPQIKALVVLFKKSLETPPILHLSGTQQRALFLRKNEFEQLNVYDHPEFDTKKGVFRGAHHVMPSRSFMTPI